MTVAENIDFEKNVIENIFTNFDKILKQDDKIYTLTSTISDLLGKLKWKVVEYEKIRVLQIADKNKIVVVLIKIILVCMKQYITYLVIIMRKKTKFQKVCFNIIVLSQLIF